MTCSKVVHGLVDAPPVLVFLHAADGRGSMSESVAIFYQISTLGIAARA